jgi:NAD(P)-dependent dehydrogenase (short-subunit alcohol dehydrogenase family)
MVASVYVIKGSCHFDKGTIRIFTYKHLIMAESTILITGASGGLGRTVVQHFLDNNVRVIATVGSDAGKKALTPHPLLNIQVVDLTDENEASDLIQEAIHAYGRIDAALLLVGGFTIGSLSDTKGADLSKMFQLNFDTAYFVARPLFAHLMEKGKGRIVLIGARPALTPAQGKNVVAYALSKSLLFHLADIFNAEAKGKDVVTHVVVPSTIDTPANRKDMPDADFSTWVQPAQLAELLYFICGQGADPLREPIWKVYNQA